MTPQNSVCGIASNNDPTRLDADASIESRIHDAAVKACTTKVGASHPITMYRGFTAYCVDRVSADALAKYQAIANAKAAQKTALAKK